MKEAIKESIFLHNGDLPAIARALKCSEGAVRKVVNVGETKRFTALQQSIIKAVVFRSKQNKELEEYCSECSQISCYNT